MASDVEEEDVVVEVKPVYYTAFCRELRVWHDSGILCYDSLSPSIPVGQFCAARPLTSECNKFSLGIQTVHFMISDTCFIISFVY